MLRDPGRYTSTWDRRGMDGVRVPRGLYTARLVVGAAVTTAKFVLLGP